jgi:hypothetical protein
MKFALRSSPFDSASEGDMGWLIGDWSEPACQLSYAMVKGDEWWLRFQVENPPATRNLDAGVYRLIGLGETDSPAVIRRVCGDDSTGTLYIGSGDILRNRLGSLIKEHHPMYKTGAHKALPPRLQTQFPADRLAVSWQFVPDHRECEQRLLDAYQAAFGEFPPLNERR